MRPAERVVSSANPDELFSALSSDPNWKRLEASGSRFTFSYTQRPFGELELADARLRALPDGAYALQAGREIRVMVMNDQVDDAQAIVMSKEIARAIETEATYPGQVRVVVVRETRASDYAR